MLLSSEHGTVWRTLYRLCSSSHWMGKCNLSSMPCSGGLLLGFQGASGLHCGSSFGPGHSPYVFFMLPEFGHCCKPIRFTTSSTSTSWTSHTYNHASISLTFNIVQSVNHMFDHVHCSWITGLPPSKCKMQTVTRLSFGPFKWLQ